MKVTGNYILGPYQTVIFMTILLKLNFLIWILIFIKLNNKRLETQSYMAKLISIIYGTNMMSKFKAPFYSYKCDKNPVRYYPNSFGNFFGNLFLSFQTSYDNLDCIRVPNFSVLNILSLNKIAIFKLKLNDKDNEKRFQQTNFLMK